MTPSTQFEALAAAVHTTGSHDFIPDRGHARDCADCWVTWMEADKLDRRLTEIGWMVAPQVSLPRSVPRGEPATAASSIDDLSDRQWAVWWLLSYRGPQTDEELVDGYSGTMVWDRNRERHFLPYQTAQSIRSRRAELVRAGHVIPTGAKRPTKAGGYAAVWKAVGDSAVAA